MTDMTEMTEMTVLEYKSYIQIIVSSASIGLIILLLLPTPFAYNVAASYFSYLESCYVMLLFVGLQLMLMFPNCYIE